MEECESNDQFIRKLEKEFKDILQKVEDKLMKNPNGAAACEYEELKKLPGYYYDVRRLVEYGFTALTEEILLCGFPVDQHLDVWKNTMLHVASLYGNSAIVRLLIKKGANVNSTTRTEKNFYPNYTPLHFAASSTKVDPYHVSRPHFLAARLLLESGAEVNARDGDLRIALHHAAITGHKDIVPELLYFHNKNKGEGTGVNARDRYECTPLHYAAENGHPYVVNLLLNDCKKDGIESINKSILSQDRQGKTALDYAVEKNHVGVIKELLKFYTEAKIEIAPEKLQDILKKITDKEDVLKNANVMEATQDGSEGKNGN